MYTVYREKEDGLRVSSDIAYLTWRINNLPQEDRAELLSFISWLLDGAEGSPGWLREWAGLWKRIGPGTGTGNGHGSSTRISLQRTYDH